jgi:hypothetical protein
MPFDGAMGSLEAGYTAQGVRGDCCIVEIVYYRKPDVSDEGESLTPHRRDREEVS